MRPTPVFIQLWRNRKFKHIILLLLICLSTTNSFSQIWSFGYAFGGGSGESFGTHLIDTTGNPISSFRIGGNSAIDMNAGSGTANFIPSTLANSYSNILTKYTNTGSFISAVKLDSAATTSSNTAGIINQRWATDGKYIYACWHFTNTIYINNVSYASRGQSDIIIVKLKVSDLSVEWVRQYGSDSTEYASSVTCDNSGNLYVLGSFARMRIPSLDTFTSYGGGVTLDCFIMKLDASGTPLWLSQGGTTISEASTSTSYLYQGIVYAPSTNKIVLSSNVGSYAGTETFTWGSRTANTVGLFDALVAEFNTGDGTCTNLSIFGTSSNDYGMSAVYDKATGDVFMSGTYSNTLSLPGSGALLPSQTTNSSIWYGRYSTTAHNFVWGKCITPNLGGGTIFNRSQSISTNHKGAIFVPGQFSGTASIGGISKTSAGGWDLFISRVNAEDGRQEWLTTAGTSTNEGNTITAADSLGNLFFSAQMTSSLTLTSENSTTLTVNSPAGASGFDILFAGTTVPTIKVSNPIMLTTTSATLGGTVVATGGKTFTSRGIVYSTSPIPTLQSGTNVSIGSGTGAFSQTVTGLTAGGTYYVRAYMIASATLDTFYTAQDTLVLGGTNTAPTFVSTSPQTLTVCQNSSATDIKTLLRVSDIDASQTLTWTVQSAPTNGTLDITAATATSGSATITPTGTCTYQPTSGYSGSDAFTVRVSDGTATADMVINVTVNPAPNAGTITGLNSVCNTAFVANSTTGTTGGVWSTSNTAVATINSSSGTVGGVIPGGVATISYSVTSGGCTTVATKLFTVYPFSDTGIVSGNLSYCVGGTGTFTSTSTRTTTPFSYSWISSAPTVATISSTTGNLTALSAGTARITYQTSGCGTFRAIRTITVSATPSLTVTSSPSVTAGSTSANLGFTSTGSPTTYTIDYDATANTAGFVDITSATTLPSSPLTLAVPSGASPGTYNGTITVSNGTCSSVGIPISVALTSSNTPPTYTNSSPQALSVCKNASATDIKTLLRASDIDASQTLTWTVQSAPTNGTLTISSATASSGSTTITPGGTCTYQPTAGYSGSDAFTVRVSDGTATADMVINVTVNAVNVSISSQTNVACNGGSTGRAVANVTGGATPYIYAWSPSGGSTATASGISAGSYTITVTDNNSCTGTAIATITQPTALSANISSQTNVACNGGSTGRAVVNVTGGTTAYNYAWSPSGGATATASGLTAGSYTCTVTDANLCTTTAVATITQPTALSAGISSRTDVACKGDSSGIAVVNVTGGTVAYTYAWSPSGGATATASGLAAGSYTCTVTDGNNCTATAVATIYEPANPVSVTILSHKDVSCYGGTNGRVTTILYNNYVGSTTHTWSPGSSSADLLVNVPAGIYTLTATDSRGCTDTAVVNITQPATALSANISSQTNVACNGGSTGIAIANATGGTAGYTYAWSPSGGATATASSLTAGSYTCTVTDANLCTTTAIATITQPTALSANISSQTNVACNGGSTGRAVVNVTGGTAAYTYAWSPSGGATATASGLTAGSYTCTVTDANLCTTTAVATITQPTALSASISSQTNVACNGGSTGRAVVNVTGGTAGYTYAWSPSGGATATASGLTAGSYTCTVTDANLCTTTAIATITQPTALTLGSGTVTNATCGATNGSAVVTVSGGTAGYTYLWSPSGGSTATGSNLGAGTYTVTVTDANLCSATRSFTITEPAGVSVSLASQTNVLCNGGSNGRAVVNVTGGTAPYTYAWSPSGGASATASGLSAGTYTCTVTDNNSCSSTQIVTITQPAVLSASISATTNVSCNGGSNGSLATSVTGGTTPYTYSWSPAGGTSATASGLTAGTYTCTITDDNSCSTTVSGTITQPSTLTLAAGSVTNVSCNGGSNGSAVAVASGGTTPYTYSWSPSGGTTATASGISAGTYTCTVTDNNSCSATRTFTVTQPSAITSSVASVTNVACNGGNTGEASITASGGTGTLSYAWAPSGGNANSASSLSAGTYTVTITDDNLCSRIQTVTVTQPSAITSSIASATNVLCNGGSNGRAVVSASGGTGTLSYSWAPAGGTTATASGLTAGTYTCTITDDNLCSRIQTVTITQPTALSASLASQNNVSCNAGSNGRAVVTATGGTSPYTYSWAPAGGSTATASGLTAGTYTCTVTDANSCETTQTVTITQPAALSVNSGAIADVTCNGGNNGSAVAVATGGTIPYTYSWSPSGGTTATGSNLTAGTYTCTVTDNNSCSASHTFTIAQPSAITSSVASITNVLCNGGNTGEAEVTASGGTGALSYSWAPAGGTSSSASGLTAGTYSVTITDANSCERVQTLTVTQPAILTTSVASQTNVSCNGGSNGRAVVAAAGGAGSYTYAWSPSGGTTATASGLSAGTYTCTVTDANLCVKTQTVTITEPATLVASSSSQTNVTCNSGSDGVAVVGVTGGTLPYTYSWAPAGGSTATASGLSLGSYTCTVTDANSCEAQHVFAIMEPAAIAVSITGATTICYNTSSNVVITATPGVTVSYNINGGSTLTALMDADGDDTISTGNITANATYNLVSVTEGSCTYPKSGSTTVSVYPNTTVDAITSQTVCNDASTTAINFTGAVSGTTYNWTNNTTSIGLAASGTGDIAAFTATNTGTSPVVATVTVTPTANGCVGASKTFSVTVNPTPDVTVPSSFAVCNNAATGNMNFSSSVSGTTYSWSNTNTAIGLAASGTGSISSFTATNSTTDPIEAVITVTPSANSCGGAAQSYTVTVNPTPVLTSTLTLTPVCDNGSVSYTPTTLTSGTSFAWSRAAVSGIANSAATGTNGFAESLDNNGTATATVSYVYTLTANGCSNVETVSVDVYPTPVLTSTLTPASICNLTTFSYAPTSATSGTTFSWSRAAVAGITNSAASGINNPNETLENTTADPIAVDYVYTLTANGCTNVETVTVTVNPGPLMSSTLTPAAICDSTLFSYVPTSATSGTVFNWSRASVSGVSNTAATGTGNPSEYLNNTSIAPVSVTYVYTLTAGGCSGIQNVSVVVNPTPELTSTLTPAAQCNSTLFTYVPTSATTGTAFEWSRASVSGISNSAAIGTDGISEVLVNTSTAPVTVTYVYTLTANNCTNIQNVSVVVNPTPVLTSTLTADPICDNTTFNYTPTSATLGTAFSWNRAAVTGISNAASGGNDNPAEILNNTTTAPITVTYVYTLTANGCSNSQNVSVVVNPTPVLSSTLTPDAICDSALFSYVPTSATTGTAFSWSRDAVTGIANSANTGINNPNENLYNTTVEPITVTYVYTLTANNCSNIQSVDVVVNPTPVLTSTLTADPICSNTTFDYTPKSATAGTTFNWSRAAITGISNLAASGSDNPSETLVNTTTDPITVTYVYTLTANGCNHIQNVTVVVNPYPKFTSTETPAAICDSTLFSYVPTSATVGTTFAWSRLSVAGIANTDATGTNNPNEYLNNTSVSPVTVIYTYTLTANGCDNVQSVSVVVNPTPELTSTLTPTAVCNNTTFHYAPTSATLGTAFSWNRATVAGILNVANSGTGDIDEVLVNTTSDPITVQYVYTLSANTCDNIQTVSVVVYPTPVLTTTLVAAPVCDSSLFSYTPNSATVGTTFAWSRAVVAGISNATAIGTDNPNEYLKNTTVNPVTVTYVYTLTANGCNNTQNVDVTVYPTPVLSSTLTPDAICDSALFSYLPTSATTGTTFSWSRAFVVGISNAANTGTDNPNETLYNTTSLPISVDYIYTLTANGCNNTQTVSVLVNPTPVLSSTLTPSAICNNTTFSYIPMSATSGVTFDWSRPAVTGISNAAATGTDNPNEVLLNTTADPITVTYVYTLTANSCSHVQNVDVVVKPTPVLSSTLTPTAICDSTMFTYTPTSNTLGTTYAWSRPAVAGISNPANADNTNPDEYLDNTTTDPIAVSYIYTLTADGCTNEQTVSVVVNPTPVLTTTLTPAPVCNTTLFSYNPASATLGTTFSWSRAAVLGISNAAATGTDNPNETLENTTADPITVEYVYTLTANSCSHVQTVSVVVNPTPVLTTTLVAAPICDSSLFSYSPNSATVGTTFEWSRAAVAGVANATASGTDNPNEYLDNTVTEPVTVTYIYTLTANGCSNTQSVTVVANPTPVLTSTLLPPAVCDSTLFSYVPTSATTGTTFSWSRASVSGILNTAATGVDNPNEYLKNTTTEPVEVTYVYTLTANGCSHEEVVTVVVNPTPVLTSVLVASPLCDSTLFDYEPSSATLGVSFSWSRAAVAGISNAAASGVGNPMEYLVNTTPDPIDVVYVDTLRAHGCYNTQNVTVTIYPRPRLSSTLTPAAICDSSLFEYTATSATVGTTFVWSRDVVAGISNPANADNTAPIEYLDNTTPLSVPVTYVYTLTANGCTNSENVTVTVYPTPVLSSTLTPSAICDNSLFSYVPTSLTPGTVFTWSRAAITGISNAAASGVGNPNEILNNTTPDPITVIYVDTLVANGCVHTQEVSVVVNPTPVLNSTLTPAAVCDSNNFHYVPTSLTAGTSFAWSRPTITGIANATATGVDSIDEVLDNTTPDPITVVYYNTLTANSCSNVDTVSVVVNPTPRLSSTHTPAAICDSALFTYVPASLTSGTVHTWSRAAVTGIANASATGVGTINETLYNLTVAPLTVIYVDTLTANGCVNTEYILVDVNPTPKITSATAATVCSGAPFSYTATTLTTGTTYTWGRALASGISNAAASGTSATVNEVLNNTTLAPKNTTYTFTLSANGCSQPYNVTVTVNPTPAAPVITTHPSNSLCAGTMYQNFGANIPAPDTVNYRWSAVNAQVYAQGNGRQYSLVNFTTADTTAYVVLTANAPGFTCYSYDTFSVNVGASTAYTPLDVFYVDGQFICADNSVSSYQWGRDAVSNLDSSMYAGEINQNYFTTDVDFTQYYYWVITTKEGCSQKTYVNKPTGVIDINTANESMNVYPNPAEDNITLAVELTDMKDVTAVLTDITGKVISRTTIVNGKTTFGVANLVPGTYMISCYHKGAKVGVSKFVKN